MADDEEWPDYSSCFMSRQESSLDSDKEDEHEEVLCEDTHGDISDVERLENVLEVLKHSIRTETSSPSSTPCAHECPSVSEIKGPFEHRVWLKLIAKLNSIRQAKWADSHLEDHYNRSLHISRNTNPQESSQITVHNFDKNWFNFHGMKTYSNSLKNGTASDERNENMPKDIYTGFDNACVNKNDMECRDKLTLLAISSGERRDDLSRKCDSTFEDLGPELEWSESDVKDDSASSNLSTVSGFDESEAAADLARLSYKEIMQLRRELQAYTKQYSDILVVELENRDAYIREKELKNNFISSFLAVQGKIREATITTNKKKFSLQSPSPLSTTQFLTTTIPYEIQNGGPRPDILEKLIEIMEAMKTNSPNVPPLLTNYILKVLCK